MLRTYTYPTKGEKIDAWEKHSKYVIKIVAPKDIPIAFYEYSQNYYAAAHLVGSYLIETNLNDISKLDTYFFSLAFLYRHSIELLLKAIAFKYIGTTIECAAFVKDTFHNLEEIFKTIENTFVSPRPTIEMDWLRKYFSDLSAMDRESDSFRYPFHIVWESNEWSMGGKFIIKRIFNKQTHIDLVKFCNKFEAAYEILQKWYTKNQQEATGWSELAPVFVEEGGYYYGQSVVGYNYNREDFYPYTKAYFDIANYLRQHMKEQYDLGKANQVERLFFPMCYMYRNCTELNLKAIWFEESGEKFQLRCKMMLDKKHSIQGMWNLIRPYAIECGNGTDDNEFITILDDYCWQLHSIDNDASKFRYPVHKNMQPYFNKNKHFDFWRIGIFLEALNNALDGIDSCISAVNEYKAEMEAEYRSDMMADYYYDSY